MSKCVPACIDVIIRLIASPPTVNYGSAGRIRTGGGGFDTHQGEAVHIGDMYDIVKVYIQCILSMCGVVK